MLRKLSLYILSFLITIIVLIYILQLPQFLTNNNPLVKEYYYDNYITNIPLDFLLILIYLLISYGIIQYMNINDNTYKLLIVMLTTLIISSIFYIIFTQKPINDNKFFSRWFHSAGFNAVIYDVILLGSVYFLYMSLDNMI